jgi:hypothetical protein
MNDASDIIRAAMLAASSSALVLDFGARPGLAVGLVRNLRAAGVRPTWDGATLTIPISNLKSSVNIGGERPSTDWPPSADTVRLFDRRGP